MKQRALVEHPTGRIFVFRHYKSHGLVVVADVIGVLVPKHQINALETWVCHLQLIKHVVLVNKVSKPLACNHGILQRCSQVVNSNRTMDVESFYVKRYIEEFLEIVIETVLAFYADRVSEFQNCSQLFHGLVR